MLTGGGSHSSYLLKAFRKEFQDDYVDVVQAEPQGTSSVAQGILGMLADTTFCDDKYARASYGTKFHVPFDKRQHYQIKDQALSAEGFLSAGQKELPDRITWGIKKVRPGPKSRRVAADMYTGPEHQIRDQSDLWTY